MEHLKKIFNEALGNAESSKVDRGRIYIRERHWAPDEILHAFGDPVYIEVFENWKTERKEDLLIKADQILEQYGQADRFNVLQQAFSRGVVMPFVGAGLSISSGYLGWTDFLHRARRQTDISEQHLSDILRNGEYERAAQEIADALGVSFNEEIEATYGLEREISGPVQLLPFVFDTPVVTTNFDSVLKRCYDNAKRSFSETVPGFQAEELPRYLGAGRRALVKLHGTAMSGIGRVLTHKEYATTYDQPELMPRVIRTICNRTLLFLGCSLTVDRLLKAIGDYVVKEGHDNVPRHYAFLAAPDDEVQRRERRAYLARFNVFPIWYPRGDDDDSIEALLYRLADSVIDL